MAESITNLKAEAVRLQIINYLQPRFGNEENSKRALNGSVNDASGEFLLRNFRQYLEKICLQNKGAVVFQCCICNDSLKGKIEGVKPQYEAVGFEPREVKGKTGYFAFKKYKNTDWRTGDLPIATLEEIAQDFENVIEITKSFENSLTSVNSQGSNKKSTKGTQKSKVEALEPWNRIYFGAPGTGKSYQLNEDVKKYFGKNFERVIFYPTYSYQQFVGSYKPFVKKIVEKNNQGQDVVRDEITYKFVPGPLMRLLVKAWKAEEGYRQALKKLEGLNSEVEQDIEAIKKANCFVLIVEELNRAEAAAVFGDFFQLLDRDENNGKSEYEISIPEELKDYLEEVGVKQEKLYLPANFYIWATMNNADQGVTPLDTAFKRRWEFEYIGLDDGKKELKTPEENLWNELRNSINKGLRKLAVNEDKLLGPFFMKAKGLTQEAFWKTFCDKVVLYLYEDAARLRRKDCFKKANVTYSELREAFTKFIKDLDACKKVLSEHFNFEMTLPEAWPRSWTPGTDSKDNASEPNASAEDASGETSGAQGESTSDNL